MEDEQTIPGQIDQKNYILYRLDPTPKLQKFHEMMESVAAATGLRMEIKQRYDSMSIEVVVIDDGRVP